MQVVPCTMFYAGLIQHTKPSPDKQMPCVNETCKKTGVDNSTVLTAVGTKGTANDHLEVASVTLGNRKTKGRYNIIIM